MSRLRRSWPAILCLAWLLAACGAQDAAAPEGPLLDRAAAEATAIIQRAQATALILQAQAQATALVAQAAAQPVSPSFPVATPTTSVELVPTSGSGLEVPPTPGATADSSAQAVVTGTVELVGVSFGADGGLIMVQFKAPPREAQKWWQGSVSVQDEASLALYNQIPVMPVIGPLIGRPFRDGQLGYVMLVNTPPGLTVGARVTVVLGSHKFEHVPVQ